MLKTNSCEVPQHCGRSYPNQCQLQLHAQYSHVHAERRQRGVLHLDLCISRLQGLRVQNTGIKSGQRKRGMKEREEGATADVRTERERREGADRQAEAAGLCV